MREIYLLKRCLLFPVILFISIGVFTPGNAFAKNFDEAVTTNAHSINGTVKDAATGNGLTGASVVVKGGTEATTTDANGAFTISVPDNRAVLVISYVGYVSQEVVVGDNTRLEISLESNASELAQVVVVGYGTQRQKDVTGSVKSLKSEAFNKGIINSPQQLLQGKVAGVNVTSVSGEPGGINAITIRGPGGVRTSNSPLFVVDGLPLDNSATGRGDPLNFLNSQDIESIDVLKELV